ncbi:HNHc domain-containing protein [Fusarium keratoplasticum]|uniref:HNHc domain-containing protein n=1 Tax=Fusarium keratoplasticum TaxID=1328300 RepID=A0ACC0QC18_9HYPO|nr:HNHc domain-containing protein [Fusarium keratoplasticum]KAI8648192.1 HNHc domain-containing protein [Fusarium keratoplasticum]
MAPPALPLHRHQSSLEGIIDFSSRPPLSVDDRASATRRFYQVINHFDNDDIGQNHDKYDRIKLIHSTYEYSISEESQSSLLIALFEFLNLSPSAHEDIDFQDSTYRAELQAVKALTKKTPQPTPASHSAVMRTQRQGHIFSGTPERIASLRGACLIRDRYRCVVSRKFDKAEALRRYRQHDEPEPRDQDGAPLKGQSFAYLEVAHILPHSLTRLSSSGELNPSRVAALTILNMFDSGAAYLIEGVDIDRPGNALTLTQNLHTSFGDFQVYFEPVDNQPHTYRIDTVLPPGLEEDVPVTRTLYLTEDRSIDPPSPRLLAIHRAIAHILHLSAAGEYIDKILSDADEHGIRSDGSTELHRLLKLRLEDWAVAQVYS